MQGQNVYVVGAGNSAGQAAVHLSKFAARVTLLVRGDSLAKSMSDYLVKEIENAQNVSVLRRTRVAAAHGEGRLDSLTLQDVGTGERTTVPAAALFVLIGAAPRTEWLADTLERDDHGFVLTGHDLTREDRLPAGWPVDRPPLLLETSMPGVFAAGDVRHRSVKRVASAVGEGSIAIQMMHEYLGSILEREISVPTAVKGAEKHGR
jgi:thioredoxin reductase (NADPH)